MYTTFGSVVFFISLLLSINVFGISPIISPNLEQFFQMLLFNSFHVDIFYQKIL